MTNFPSHTRAFTNCNNNLMEEGKFLPIASLAKATVIQKMNRNTICFRNPWKHISQFGLT